MDELIKIGAKAMRARAREADMDGILETLSDDEFEKFAQAAIRVWGWPVGVGNLLIELSGLLRGYEKHHRDKAATVEGVQVAQTIAKAETNREWADKIDEKIALLIEGPDDIWPVGAEFQLGDHVMTKRGPWFIGPVVGWYRPSHGRLGFNVELDAVEGLIHVYPASGLMTVECQCEKEQSDLPFCPVHEGITDDATG